VTFTPLFWDFRDDAARCCLLFSVISFFYFFDVGYWCGFLLLLENTQTTTPSLGDVCTLPPFLPFELHLLFLLVYILTPYFSTTPACAAVFDSLPACRMSFMAPLPYSGLPVAWRPPQFSGCLLVPILPARSEGKPQRDSLLSSFFFLSFPGIHP